MNFSLILPSRGRVQLLSNLCRSVHNTTADAANIEMLVGYDWDDQPTVRAIPEMQKMYPWLKGHGRDRGNSISRDYQNWLYPKSTGKYLFILNDDVEIKTNRWDEIAFNKLDTAFRDGIVYGWVSDSDENRFGKTAAPYSCFPIVSRKAVERLGYVMHEYYGGWSADVYLFKVYNAANRVVDLSEILAHHQSHWLGIRDRDETNWSMQQKSVRDNMIDHTADAKKLDQSSTFNLITLL